MNLCVVIEQNAGVVAYEHAQEIMKDEVGVNDVVTKPHIVYKGVMYGPSHHWLTCKVVPLDLVVVKAICSHHRCSTKYKVVLPVI